MQLGMIGLGRMGSDMTRRLMKRGHKCVVYDTHAQTISKLQTLGAIESTSVKDLVSKLATPRVIWLMLPAAVVDHELTELALLLSAGDIIIDGGNSYYRD